MQGPRRGQAQQPPRQHLVLAGGGHVHALLLRRWLMRPGERPPATRVSLVNRHGSALYSGLVPALLAGLEQRRDCAIDLRLLCARAGVCFIQAEILGLDVASRQVRLAGRPPLRFDQLSLDVGAVVDPCGAVWPVKPLEPLLAWLDGLPAGAELRIRGGGAAALEVALALRARGFAVQLLLRGDRLRLGSPAAARAAEALLERAGIRVQRRVASDAPAELACTGSRAPAWLAASGLPVDPASGRLLTDASLEVCGHPGLFASGDCAQIAAAPRPPSGVWAVRAAPLLAANLQARLSGGSRPLRRWRPQRRALQLLGDAGAGGSGGTRDVPRALACWGPLVWGPSIWLWRWKQAIDHRFMDGFQPRWAPDGLPQASPGRPGSEGPGSDGASSEGSGEAALACRGCAAKLAAAPLEAALDALRALGPTGEGAGSEGPVDAPAVARLADGQLLLQSLDGFPALVDDPWLNGRLTALHACSDLWASGARVSSAQALVTVPVAKPPLQQELLLQSLAGVRSALDPLGAPLIGGHTLEARDGGGLALALVVNGRLEVERSWSKGPLQRGDALLLSRPLGSGVLFAAAMAGAAPADWIDAALALLGRDQAALVALLAAHGCRACTDVTGFGLLGHLGEMLPAGGEPAVVVELDGAAIPALPGALELLGRGWSSSLAPANAEALRLLAGPLRLRGDSPARRALLVDPQTCGPLLAALPAARAEAAVQALRRAGFSQAALIGRVLV
ncbi:MAG: selenide, water dikinase SelD [Synechococcaceae cyanobacterium]|nr:selenide, water dikinase SelD [Synechococcaceae cyanobacterium]